MIPLIWLIVGLYLLCIIYPIHSYSHSPNLFQPLSIIAEEEGGGGINSLQALEADLKKEEEALAENKELLNKMNTLMSTVSYSGYAVVP